MLEVRLLLLLLLLLLVMLLVPASLRLCDSSLPSAPSRSLALDLGLSPLTSLTSP